jgi:uncharacterized repeat protein (TIGR03803 family)
MKANSQKTRYNAVSIIILCLITTLETGGQTFTPLYTFTFQASSSALVLSSNVLYGATDRGGTSGEGSVFSVNSDGTHFTTLYSFNSPSGTNNSYGVTNTDGASPAGLILSGNTLYGTSINGGASANGTIFAIQTDGTGFTNLHNFNGDDGANPFGRLFVSGNILYGTTFHGGIGDGTVFALNTDGTGFTNLHTFSGTDASTPFSGLALSGDVLYGTAPRGGALGNGAVYSIHTDGTGFTNLHDFTPIDNSTNGDGSYVQAGLIVSGGTLYGMAGYGGSAGNGTIFKLNCNGTGFTTLYDFSPSIEYVNGDGELPVGGLVLSGDTLYGVANIGGSGGDGTIFQLDTDGTGFMTLHTFTAGSDGFAPYVGLILSANSLFGMAEGPGVYNRIFSLTLPIQLGITASGPNVVLTWPTNVAGLTLQSTPSLTAPAVWTPVSPAPVVVNGLNTVTNPMSGAQQFYRLSQ